MECYVNNKDRLLRDVKDFRSKGYTDRMLKLYRRLPKTECAGCGLCCTDSPIITYPEFLFICEYFFNDTNFDNESKISIYKNAIRNYMFGLIKKNIYCPFLGEDKKCLIYERAPLACKRWGVQSIVENERDVSADHLRNKKYKDFYALKGIIIPEDATNFKIPYCENVKIVNNPYNFLSSDFDTVVLKDMMKMILDYRNNNALDWSVGYYLLYNIFGKSIYEDRIEVIKEYQSGNQNAVEEYIVKIDFNSLI